MHPHTPYDEHTWDLIASALQGDLSPEEDVEFRQWLASSPGNRESYEQLLRYWQDTDMEDYPVYAEADDAQAWEGFQRALSTRRKQGKQAPDVPFSEAPVIRGEFTTPVTSRKWLVAAAALLLTAGAGWWYYANKESVRSYETAQGEQRWIALPDGSTVVLQPQTRLELAAGYNRTGRTIHMVSGVARFDVAHQTRQPFIVDMDAARVQDIGTRFTIQKAKDSITVAVTTGKVSFLKKRSGDSREISAGGSIRLYTGTLRAGEMRETAFASNGADSLRFVNVPLSAVLASLEKHFGKSIRLTDSLVGQKKLTIKLDGESLEDALRLICASMHLEYTLKSGEYVLVKKDSAR